MAGLREKILQKFTVLFWINVLRIIRFDRVSPFLIVKLQVELRKLVPAGIICIYQTTSTLETYL